MRNFGGRPPKWDTPEELYSEVETFFAECDSSGEMPTKAGLAYHLHTCRDTLCEYLNNKHEFSDTIKRAYQAIEMAWSQRLVGTTPTGAIFYLKAAFKYKDRIDHTTDDKPIKSNTIIFSDFQEKDDSESK